LDGEIEGQLAVNGIAAAFEQDLGVIDKRILVRRGHLCRAVTPAAPERSPLQPALHPVHQQIGQIEVLANPSWMSRLFLELIFGRTYNLLPRIREMLAILFFGSAPEL
jgi:hypothetical protein